MTRSLFAAVAFALLALGCAAFVRLNAAPVTLDLFFATWRTGVGQATVLAFVAGWAAGVLGAVAWVAKLARERARLAQAVRMAEAEARTLRATAPAHAR